MWVQQVCRGWNWYLRKNWVHSYNIVACVLMSHLDVLYRMEHVLASIHPLSMHHRVFQLKKLIWYVRWTKSLDASAFIELVDRLSILFLVLSISYRSRCSFHWPSSIYSCCLFGSAGTMVGRLFVHGVIDGWYRSRGERCPRARIVSVGCFVL